MFIDDLPLDPSAPIVAFDQREPGPDQRWSTWPAVVPTSRGPQPHPPWVVTAAGAFDTELGIVKSGKEADLSPYNLLVRDGRVIVIDLPQLVEIVSNPAKGLK